MLILHLMLLMLMLIRHLILRMVMVMMVKVKVRLMVTKWRVPLGHVGVHVMYAVGIVAGWRVCVHVVVVVG